MAQTLPHNIARLGILGGTFNPIHCGHVEMAAGVLRAYRLDSVLLIPANDPPHKRMETPVPAAHRLRMVALAVEGIPGLAASGIECRRPGKSYTIDTLFELQAAYPGAHLFVITGSDMLRDLPGWHRAEELLKMASFIGVTRQEQSGGEAQAAAALRSEYGADVLLSTMRVPPASSTDIRERILRALPVEGLLPAAVERYIYRHGLYLPLPLARIHARLQTMIPPARLTHTMGVVQSTVWLADAYGVNTQKARLAALLHDCARTEGSDALGHAAGSARIAEVCFGVRDAEVLDAIARHTVLGAAPSPLAQVLYLADAIEPGRSYTGADALRALSRRDLSAAVRLGLEQSIAHVHQSGREVHPDSLRALESFPPK